MLTEEEIQQIHLTTLRDIIRETTSIDENELQENVSVRFFYSIMFIYIEREREEKKKRER